MLIEDWKKAGRFLSVQLSALGAAASAAWVLMPPEQQAGVLTFLGIEKPGTLAAVGFAAVIVGRLIAQPALDREV
jgi:uncharacterized membrane protein HdeD (DUF308 family)